jgi:hypothetical protein
MKAAKLSMLVFLSASIAGAATLTVGPSGQYATPCAALHSVSDGDTVLIDANHGIAYTEPPDPSHGGRSDCRITNNDLTIRGVHGRAVLNATGEYIQKAIFVLDGHDITVDNLEFTGAATPPGGGDNGAGIKVEAGSNSAPAGGNITVTNSYFHDNQDGYLSNSTGPGIASWFVPNSFTMLKYDDFYRNGAGDGESHNIYIGADLYLQAKFTLEYSKSRDSFIGHLVKTRAPYNYILYNQISDSVGASSYSLDFCLGGTSYVIGNILYKATATNPNANYNMMIFADVYDNAVSDPEYAVPNQDLHFQNNIVIDDNQNGSNSFINVSCDTDPNTACPAPSNGPPVTTPAVITNNLFIGLDQNVTNQTIAKAKYNLVLPYSDIAAAGYKLQ